MTNNLKSDYVYDQQLEIRVIYLLFQLEFHPPEIILSNLLEILDLTQKWNIWLLGRNIYHVSYCRAQLIIPLCELTYLAKAMVVDQIPSSNADYSSEWNSAFSISIISNDDDFYSCAPPESVYTYGYLCKYGIVDPTSRFRSLQDIIASSDTESSVKELMIQTLIPLLLSCLPILRDKFETLYSSIVEFLKINQMNNTQANPNNIIKYGSMYKELQTFLEISCDINEITPFIFISPSKEKQQLDQSLNISAIERENELESEHNSSTDNTDEYLNFFVKMPEHIIKKEIPFRSIQQNRISSNQRFISYSNRIHIILSTDDIDTFQQLASDKDFSVDQRIDSSLVCCYEFLMYKPTMIQLSAFYGALKCFRFLLVNQASITMRDLNDESPNSIASFAIAGGNLEIIRLLISGDVNFELGIFLSVSLHRDALFFWFLENQGIENISLTNEGSSLLHYSAESNNLRIADFLIKNKIEIVFTSNYDENNIDTPLNLACAYDCIGILKLICENYDNIPREAIVNAFSKCIASNSAQACSYLIHFMENAIVDGQKIYQLSLDEIKQIKENHMNGFGELKIESEICKMLNEMEVQIQQKP